MNYISRHMNPPRRVRMGEAATTTTEAQVPATTTTKAKTPTATWGTGTRVAVGTAIGGVTAGAIGGGISMAMKSKRTALAAIGAGFVGALIGGGAGFLFGSGLQEP